MANHKSAEKRSRQNARKAERNSQAKATVRTFEKKLRKAIADKDVKNAQGLFLDYTSKIGKAAQKGLVHAKTASRKIGRIAKQVSQLGS